ncbi:MAG: prepilin-type N-terminal cleavage/methylation domain-containing protein [Clostridiales bacterium]|nr:MAG: prepilin-type N-terminal cleavage/methylation domain-containing protein [Clostridiales bacterium]
MYNKIMKSDKKGFTLVELIVVIAIMAVLAGVVSGATVGILNKKTDEVNYIYNGKQISAQIVSWAQEVVERPAFFTELTGIEIDVTDLCCMAVSTQYGRTRTRKPLTIP